MVLLLHPENLCYPAIGGGDPVQGNYVARYIYSCAPVILLCRQVFAPTLHPCMLLRVQDVPTSGFLELSNNIIFVAVSFRDDVHRD